MTRSGPRSRTRKIRPWLHPRLAPALVVALATLSLLAPAAARAALGVSSVSVTPAAPPAGAHVDIGISIGISGASASPDGQLDNLRIHLPPGLVGNPSATPRCPQATFEANGCPSNTVVGSTTVHALAWVLGLGPAAVDASGTIYNVEPGPGEPARLGAKVDVLPIPLLGLPGFTFHVPVGVSLRPTDYGLDATITGIPASAVGATLAVTGMDLTLEGAPSGASGTAFVTTPTTCAPATVTVEAASKAEPESYASASGSFTPSDCDGLPPFDPGTTVDLETTRSDTPSAYTIAVTVPPEAGAAVRRQSHVRRTTVVLPKGTTLSPPSAVGMSACTDAQFAKGSASPIACPDSSKLGDVQIDTPLLGTLDGSVFLGTPTPSAPIRLFVGVQQKGLSVKLIGLVHPAAADGQITTVFDDLPQVPFTAFRLMFRAARAPSSRIRSTAAATRQRSSRPRGAASPTRPALRRSTSAATARGRPAPPRAPSLRGSAPPWGAPRRAATPASSS